ncbi:hypothetical protein BDR04DRAFT_169153 [Suillus decipiens]|nr:hypothetical protein BDR04DRAFT_169153 [Suillus decipiens]
MQCCRSRLHIFFCIASHGIIRSSIQKLHLPPIMYVSTAGKLVVSDDISQVWGICK